MGGQSTNIPLKVNTAGVIPVIFASSLMQNKHLRFNLFDRLKYNADDNDQ